MGAWVGQAGGGYWVQEGMAGGGLQQYAEKPCKERCGLDSGRLCAKEGGQEEEEEEESRRRMVELMLGPCNPLFSSNAQQPPPPTLDLLNAPLLLNNSSSLPLSSSMDSTPIELEPDSPLPSGWEKCLDLKTGSIYYLNRSMGLNSSADPRKALLMYHGKSARADLNSWPASPTTSEVTMEATMKSTAKQVALNMNEKCGGDEGALDLNLSLHVGQSPSKPPPHHVSVSAKACPSLHPATTFKAPSSVPCMSSSSSSITSPPINSSFPFSNSSMSGKEARPSASEDIDNSINKQDSDHFSQLALKESRFCGGSMNADYPLSSHSSRNAETSQLPECQGHGTSNTPMVTVACANCLMFVMLSRSNPKCPRCGTCPDQLDFPQPPLKRAKLGFSF